MAAAATPKSKDFSLINGGPTHRLMLRMGLLPGITRRAVFFAVVTWLPLLILSATAGLAVGKAVTIPFLMDYLSYARFLIALPLLILAERIVEPMIALAARAFVTSGLLDESEHADYWAARAEAERLCDSALAEGLVVGLAYLVALSWMKQELTRQLPSWAVLMSTTGTHGTPAGWWYALVSVPIYQFMLYRWLWRIAVWSRFLWRMSRLDLRLMPTHPDQAGGLGFLANAHLSFASIVFPVGVVWSATFHRELVHKGTSFETLQIASGAFAVLTLIICLGPLLVFTPKLLQSRLKALREYGWLALFYTQSFHRKWIQGGAPEGELLLGSSDIQSLADMGGSFERIRNTRILPFERKTVVGITVAALLPMVPLVLLVTPLKEIVKRLLALLA